MDSKGNGLLNEHIDRISDLHDSILDKILSYLPVKDTIATCILSTRWKNLFPYAGSLVRLDLDDSHMPFSPSRMHVEFVDKLLNVTLLNVKCVESVVLNCVDGYGDDKIVSWVYAFLRLNVKHLRLLTGVSDSKAFFGSLHGCTTLVELEIGCNFGLSLPEEFILPNLKRLSLNLLTLGGETDTLYELLKGCPLLEDLRIDRCDLGYLDTVSIQHPVINKLFIDGSFIEDRCRVVIDAPNLKAFAFKGQYVPEYVLMNVKALRSVCIDYLCLKGVIILGRTERCDSSYRLAKLVKACSSTTRIRLPGNSVELCDLSCVSLPTFPNLTFLALGCMEHHGWRMLAQFLENAPNLTTLTFEDELDLVHYQTNAKSPPASLPVFLKPRLKKIEIWEFGWTSVEIELIQYFLKNGRMLEELIIHCLPHKNKIYLQKLSMLHRHSKACQVLVKDKRSRAKPCYSRESWFQTGHA